MFFSKMFKIKGLFCPRSKVFENSINIKYLCSPATMSNNTENKVEVFEKVKPENEINITEDKTPVLNDFIKVLEKFSTDKGIQLTENINSLMAAEVLQYLALKKFRNKKLIESLCSIIHKNPSKLNFNSWSKVLYSAAILSYKNEAFLNLVANQVASKSLEQEPPSRLTSMLQSIGILKFRNCELIDILISHITERINRGPTFEILISYVTLATINYHSPYEQVLFNELKSLKPKDFNSSKSFLNYVWASVILNNISAEHVKAVLSQNIVNSLIFFSDYSSANLKLQNINSAAQYLLHSYDGPFLKTELFKPKPKKAKRQLLQMVVDGLHHLFSKEAYLRINLDIGAGFILDVECFIDSNGQASSPYAVGAKKVGILLFSFDDYCLDKEETLAGVCSFWQKILVAKGYNVVTISHSEFKSALTLGEKIEILKKKIKEACNN